MAKEFTQKISPTMNLATLLEKLVSSSGGEEFCQTIELRRKSSSFADARLFFKDKAWQTSSAGRSLLAILEAHPAIAAVHHNQTTISLRFTDEYIAALGKCLETEQLEGLETKDLLTGKTYAVGFAGPNTSKALHVGHLRNISIGNAIAAALTLAGARVLRQSLIGDIGRNVCEAMAGFRHFHNGEDPIVKGVKPDHFVGMCYTKYLREFYHKYESRELLEDPVAREVEITDDLADQFMGLWLANDPEVRKLWYQVRNWALAGQQQTLERLGVRMDRHDYESEAVGDVARLMVEGLRKGILMREEDGTILYKSGRAEFDTIVLVRKDGFPTEHARLLAVYDSLLEEWQEHCTYLDLAGSEWQPASALHMDLVGKLRPNQPNRTIVQLFHEMVVINDSKMNSSDGEAILIDELLDRLVESQAIRSVADLSEGTIKASIVADIVVKAYFLCQPTLKPLKFSWNLLMDEKINPGWMIARAWCDAMSVGKFSTTDPAPDNDDYRLAVIRSHDFRHNLKYVTRTFTPMAMTSYLLHLCPYFLKNSGDARIHRVARTALRTTLNSLGLATTVSGLKEQQGEDINT